MASIGEQGLADFGVLRRALANPEDVLPPGVDSQRRHQHGDVKTSEGPL